MTFNEAVGWLMDRLGERVAVTVAGRSERGPAVAMTATGKLAPGFDQEKLAAAKANDVIDTVAFGFEEPGSARFYLAPDEFRDALSSSDTLTIYVGEDVEIRVEPPLPRAPDG